MKIRNIILTIIFALLLILPVCNQFLHLFSDVENTENRALAEMPTFNLDNLDPFPTQYEDYHQDHFFMRNWFNKEWSRINREIFKKSPTDKALIGRNDWLYIKKEELETYLGQNMFDDEELEKFTNEIIRRRDYLDSINCTYYFVVAPIKYSVYPEYLPRVYQIKDNYTRTDQVVEAISKIENVHLIDLRKTLNESKNFGQLYRSTDNHWNELGAYYAYTGIVNEIRKDFPEITPPYPLDSFNIEMIESKGGNVAQMMNAIPDYQEIIPKLSFKNQKVWEAEKAGYPAPKNFGFASVYEVVNTNHVKNSPTILFIRDSFGHTIIPYLSAHFSKSVYIFDYWKYMLNQDIVDNEKPDIFIQMPLECHYTNLLNNVGK